MHEDHGEFLGRQWTTRSGVHGQAAETESSSGTPHEHHEHVDGVEQFSLVSAGIDIGTSTSHVTLSRLTVRRRGADLSTRFEVTHRQVLYRSPVILTPYLADLRLDRESLERHVEGCLREAGVAGQDIDTGVVVVTGQALTRENARELANRLAEAGRFLCVSAGPRHEATLAAYGSGAVDLSAETGGTVLNVDMGGGTTKLTVAKAGEVVDVAAVDVGARLFVLRDGRLARIERPGHLLLAALGLRRDIGDPLSDADRARLVDLIVDQVHDAVSGRTSALLDALMLTPPLGHELSTMDSVVFSGGVAEYVYGREDRDFGDLGRELGAAFRRRFPVGQPVEGIRATVLGAGQYSMQASGLTSYLSPGPPLPVVGLRVVSVPVGADVVGEAAAALARIDLPGYESGVALALEFAEHPDYRRLRRAAEGVRAVVGGSDAAYLAVDVDVAKSLGTVLVEELGYPGRLVVIDGVHIGALDFLDIGAPLGTSESLPVTVKSLVFPTQAGSTQEG